jgi:hypothetical protein
MIKYSMKNEIMTKEFIFVLKKNNSGLKLHNYLVCQKQNSFKWQHLIIQNNTV